MQLLKPVASLMSLAIAALGVWGLLAPAGLLAFAQSLLAPPNLYFVALVRVLFGALLILVASGSRWKTALRAIGIVLVIAGVLTPVFPTDRLVTLVGALAERPAVMRAAAILPLLVGLALAYAINQRPPPPAA